MKRLSGLCLWFVVVASTPSSAQSSIGAGSIVIPGPDGQPPPGRQTCVQVEVAGEPSSAYNCLNQQLQEDVQGENSSQPRLPLTENSASNQLGTFNETSMREQYGQNFGKSVIPYRPVAPNFNASLRP